MHQSGIGAYCKVAPWLAITRRQLSLTARRELEIVIVGRGSGAAADVQRSASEFRRQRRARSCEFVPLFVAQAAPRREDILVPHASSASSARPLVAWLALSVDSNLASAAKTTRERKEKHCRALSSSQAVLSPTCFSVTNWEKRNLKHDGGNHERVQRQTQVQTAQVSCPYAVLHRLANELTEACQKALSAPSDDQSLAFDLVRLPES